MANVFQELGVYVEAATPLTRPNHGFSSFSQLARRARAQEDKLRRVVARLGAELNDPLIGTTGRRLALTDVGRDLLTRANEILALAKARIEEAPALALRVGVEVGLDTSLVAEAARLWLKEWQGLATLQLRSLPSDLVLEHLSSGLIDVGLGWAHSFPVDPGEVLAPALPLVAVMEADHELAASTGPLEASAITDRVLIGATAEEPAAEHVQHIPSALRAVVDSAALSLLVSRGGVGIGFTIGQPRGLVCREIKGAEPASLGLFFPPGRAEARSEPGKFFAEVVRSALARATAATGAPIAEALA